MPHEDRNYLTGDDGWRCNNCRWFWETEENAARCEEMHVQDNRVIAHMPSNSLLGRSTSTKREVEVIDVDFSE